LDLAERDALSDAQQAGQNASFPPGAFFRWTPR
jgi:hypothetical protein